MDFPRYSERTAAWLTFWIRYVVPAALFAVLAGFILSTVGEL